MIIFVVARTRLDRYGLDRYELFHSQFGYSHEVRVVSTVAPASDEYREQRSVA